ncbi:MAG: YdcF family protein [Burkholderiales bacterium]|nr:YdcF family protein [Burkholderiales bacterium]
MYQLFKQLILPPAGPLLLALAGLAAMGSGRRWGRWPLGLGLLLAWLLTTDAVVSPLVDAYVDSPPSRQILHQAQAWTGRSDAVVLVLGGGIRRASSADGGYDLQPLTSERLRRGLWWSKRLKLPLAFSGGLPAVGDADRPTESSVVARVLGELGAPPALWFEGRASNTQENARFSAELLRRHGTKKVILVTHGLHMPRALHHFRSQVPDVEILPAPLHRDPEPGWILAQWLPSSAAAAQGSYLVYEWVARTVGK